MSEYKDLEFAFESAKPLDISIETNNRLIELGVAEGGSGRLPPYTGDYNVIPQTYPQELNTKNKSMTQNVTVEPYETINVIDNLDSDSSVDALAARQGKILKNMIPEDEQIHFDAIDAMFAAVFGE